MLNNKQNNSPTGTYLHAGQLSESYVKTKEPLWYPTVCQPDRVGGLGYYVLFLPNSLISGLSLQKQVWKNLTANYVIFMQVLYLGCKN